MAAFRLGALRDLFGKSDESKRRKSEEARPKLEVLREAARVARAAPQDTKARGDEAPQDMKQEAKEKVARGARKPTEASESYTAADIEVLEGLEPVRRLHGVGVSVVNALSEKLEVEVARGQQLYAMTFSRGAPQGKLQKLGAIKNRRGTKVRFKPDEKIFGKGATFKPARLLRMARSKAYLFGGVEIRWFCPKSLITDDTPVEATFHFPGGLKEYLEATIEGQTRVTKDIFAGRVEREGGHGSVEWAVCWVADEDGFLNSYCTTIPTAEGGTHENGFRSALGKALRDFGERVANKRAVNI